MLKGNSTSIPTVAGRACILLSLMFGAAAFAQSEQPIILTTRHQLFVDDFVTADSFAVEFQMCRPQKYPGNPVMRPEMPWEGAYLSADTVVYDGARHEFRMWYRGWADIRRAVRWLCYATSEDGVHWERPDLGLVEFDGSTKNNIAISPPDMTVLEDLRDRHSSRRYKGAGRFDTVGLCVAFSPDGLRWTYDRKPEIERIGDGWTLLGWDDAYQAYVGYFRPPADKVRKIARATSSDFVHWTPLQTVLEPDEHDPFGTQFYNMHVMKYEGVYFGLLSVLHIDAGGKDASQPDPDGAEQTVDTQLAFSRDGIHWTRIGNRQPWLALGPYQSWEDMQNWPVTPVVVGDEIWIYYSGVNVRHQIPDLRRVGTRINGRWLGGQIGLAKLRLDGWVVARPERERGWILTKPMTLDGETLWVNADARGGRLTAAVLDETGRPVPGFDRYSCLAITRDGTAIPMKWRAAQLGTIAGRTVRFKFHLDRAGLYSFWAE